MKLYYFKVHVKNVHIKNESESKYLYIRTQGITEAKTFASYLWNMSFIQLSAFRLLQRELDPELEAIFTGFPGQCYIDTRKYNYKSLNIIQLQKCEVRKANKRFDKLDNFLKESESE